jgi:LacI family transcriptional regulator
MGEAEVPAEAHRAAARRVGIADVARRAEVSRTTVSFVLSGRDDMRISEATRIKVLRAARELEYRPNLTARSLRTRRSGTVGLLSDSIASEQYAGELIQGCLQAAAERGHLLQVLETNGDLALETRHIHELISRQVDGFLYASLYTRHVRLPASLDGQPVVLLNCLPDPGNSVSIPAVIPDEVAGGRDASQVLLDAGHRDRIFLVGETLGTVWAAQERLEGIGAALAAAGTALAGQLPCTWWPDDAFASVTDLVHAGGRPRALICLNDRVALGAYQALQAAGLRIPEDVSVVAFDDSPLAAWLRPALTSIALPHAEMGRLAVERLLDGRAGRGVTRVAMPFRRRYSVAAPHIVTPDQRLHPTRKEHP